jgi:molecular chaperone GrpE (heat shock protein)
LRNGAAASAGSVRGASKGSARDGSANIALLLSDCVCGEDESPVVASKGLVHGGRRTVGGQVATRPVQVALKTKAANLDKQMEEFRAIAQGVQQTAIEQSKPLNDALTQLTQQVSAIREYAACQQQRIERLQDGYDWNIVKRFCLRVIRCIDNLEGRIARLCELGVDAEDLGQVKDEMIFALESSGVEQFQPEIGREFRGLQKCAEAVREKQSCDDPDMVGKIACVIRLGYRYHVEEGNVKIVRPAQVKLYG